MSKKPMAFSEDAMKDAQALIAGMELPYLRQLQDCLAVEIKEREKQGQREAKLKIQQIAADLGMTVAELMQGAVGKTKLHSVETKRVTGPAAPKYRDPATGVVWSGRGLAPKWFKEAIAAGKAKEDLLIAA